MVVLPEAHPLAITLRIASFPSLIKLLDQFRTQISVPVTLTDLTAQYLLSSPCHRVPTFVDTVANIIQCSPCGPRSGHGSNSLNSKNLSLIQRTFSSIVKPFWIQTHYILSIYFLPSYPPHSIFQPSLIPTLTSSLNSTNPMCPAVCLAQLSSMPHQLLRTFS